MNYPKLVEYCNNGGPQEAFGDYLEAERESIFKEISQTGAILFRGFGIDDKEAFEKSVQCLQPKLREYVGGDSPREKVGGRVYTSTSFPSSEDISMHNEMSYTNNYPRFIFFYCEIKPEVGGETPIADAREILKKLPPEIVEKFQTKKLKYIMNLHDGFGLGKSWKEAYQVSTVEEVEKLLDRPNVSYQWKENGLLQVEEIVNPVINHPETGDALFFSQADQWHPSGLKEEVLSSLREIMSEDDFYHHCRYGDDSAIAAEDLKIIKEVVDAQRVFFTWEKGDLLMLDNIISLHGRSPFSGKRSILVAMS